MATLVIFSAIYYLLGGLKLSADSLATARLVTAIVGLVVFVLACLGVDVPACFRS